MWANLLARAKLPCERYVKENQKLWSGPTRESNWVLPGKLLVGAYPLAWVERRGAAHINARDLHSLLDTGINTFVCLQSECPHMSLAERDDAHPCLLEKGPKKVVRRGESRGAQKFVYPYILDAARAMEERLGSWEGHLRYFHLPIADLKCTRDGPVFALAFRLACEIAATNDSGAKIYLHCWGGHGRTGTLVAVILGLLFNISAEEALERTQLLHDMRRSKLQVRSPQTDLQCIQVRRILGTARAQAARALLCKPQIPVPAPCGFQLSLDMAPPAKPSVRQAVWDRAGVANQGAPRPVLAAAAHPEVEQKDAESRSNTLSCIEESKECSSMRELEECKTTEFGVQTLLGALLHESQDRARKCAAGGGGGVEEIMQYEEEESKEDSAEDVGGAVVDESPASTKTTGGGHRVAEKTTLGSPKRRPVGRLWGDGKRKRTKSSSALVACNEPSALASGQGPGGRPGQAGRKPVRPRESRKSLAAERSPRERLAGYRKSTVGL